MNTTITYLDSPYRERLLLRPPVTLTPDGPPRLNVVLPNFFREFAFGGIASAMQLARVLASHYSHTRFVSIAPLGSPDEMFPFADYAANSSAASLEDGPLPCTPQDVFLCTHHATVKLWEAHAHALIAANLQPNPFYYFIQDYEPGFQPFGYHNSAAAQTYSHSAHAHAIFNSRELAAYFHSLGLTFAREYTIVPSPHPDMLTHLNASRFRLRPKDPSRLTILCYGRPGSPRNCFEAILEGLYLHLATLTPSQRATLTLLSAGRPHDNIALTPDTTLTSLGKLPIPRYIATLEHAHVGISLMASPHPSYPPLEMALFGLQTITNSFPPKDLATTHPNIISIPAPLPELLAAALPTALHRAQAAAGKPQKALIPSNMAPIPWADNVRRIGIAAITPQQG